MKTLFDPDLTLEDAEALIKNGADVNSIDSLLRTPLFYAIPRYRKTDSYNILEILQLLIKHGADVNYLDFFHENPFMFYLIQEYLSDKDKEIITQFFISHGINVNNKDHMGFTALSRTQNSKIIQLLIQNKAVATSVYSYQKYRDLFTKEQLSAFDVISMLSSNDNDFFKMCLEFNEDIKNDVNINIKEIEIE